MIFTTVFRSKTERLRDTGHLIILIVFKQLFLFSFGKVTTRDEFEPSTLGFKFILSSVLRSTN